MIQNSKCKNQNEFLIFQFWILDSQLPPGVLAPGYP